MVEWYGDKQAALDASKILPVLRSCRHTRTGLMISAADWQQKERCRRISFEVKSLIGEYEFVITSYPLLRRDIAHYKEFEFSYCFIDEAQHIKNPKTMNARSVKKINAEHKFAPYRYTDRKFVA